MLGFFFIFQHDTALMIMFRLIFFLRCCWLDLIVLPQLPQVAADAFGSDTYSAYGKTAYASSTSAYMLIYRQVRVRVRVCGVDLKVVHL